MKNLIIEIKWNERPDITKGYSILSQPYQFKVELNEEKTKIYNQFGGQGLLDTWAEQIIKLQFPLYDGVLISAKVIN